MRNWDTRLHFRSGSEFVTARNVVNTSGCKYECKSITAPIPEGMVGAQTDRFVRGGTLFLMVNDYLKLRDRLLTIQHRIEVLNPRVKA